MAVATPTGELLEVNASLSRLLGRSAAGLVGKTLFDITHPDDAATAKLQLQQPHVVRMETRPPNMEGAGEVTQRALLRNSLRMRPDRIILGEVRGGEVLDMLQAMNTGHEGSMSTIHANTPRDALTRMEAMCLMAGADLPIWALREIPADEEILISYGPLWFKDRTEVQR